MQVIFGNKPQPIVLLVTLLILLTLIALLILLITIIALLALLPIITSLLPLAPRLITELVEANILRPRSKSPNLRHFR